MMILKKNKSDDDKNQSESFVDGNNSKEALEEKELKIISRAK